MVNICGTIILVPRNEAYWRPHSRNEKFQLPPREIKTETSIITWKWGLPTHEIFPLESLVYTRTIIVSIWHSSILLGPKGNVYSCFWKGISQNVIPPIALEKCRKRFSMLTTHTRWNLISWCKMLELPQWDAQNVFIIITWKDDLKKRKLIGDQPILALTWSSKIGT